MNNILVIGSLNMDFMLEVDHIPLPGETILGKQVSLIPGGKGANQAYTLGKLERNVQMIGAVGDDDFGERLIQNLRKVGVKASGIAKKMGVPSGQAFIHVSKDGENSITVIQGANQKITKQWIEKQEDLIKACDVLIMQLEIPLDVVTYAAQKAKNYGKFVVLDPAPAAKNLPEELLRNIDIIKPNETEISILTDQLIQNKTELLNAARGLLDKGIGNVIVTLGEEGVLFASKTEEKFFEAEKVTVVDTTAAGDSFTAALVSALQVEDEGMINYEEAIRFAIKVAGIVVSRKGAQSSIPSLEEVKCYMTSS